MRLLSATTAILLATATLASADDVATCLFEKDDAAAIVAACSAALAATDDPVEQGRLILHRGLGHEGLGDLQAARLDQMLASAYRPDWFLGFANAASLSIEMDDPDTALRMAQAAIDTAPENPRAYAQMIEITSYGDDPTQCLPHTESAMGRLEHPIDWPFTTQYNAFLFGSIGYCLQQNERTDEAMHAYLAAEYLEPDNQWLISQIATLFYQIEQDERALEYVTRALAYEEPYLYDVHVLVGANTYLGRLDDALEAVTEYADFIDAADFDQGTRNLIGWTLFRRDRAADAGPVMERWATWAMAQIEAGRPQAGEVWDTVANVRAANGDTQGAAEAFRLAFENAYDDDVAREQYRYELIQAGFEVGEGDAGILAALDACAATGPACRLVPDDEELDDE